ncbi:hypothetical protein [Engelhardtia mirabilis]|uniref:Uncharacterized protein n=1 Tax=Engelhardtia mirabilis TaxID=2528011 RepID=A0A518BN82_9BACT|nr:hypothetical protein Pla133_35370 [Planctomycetes bacterium Pla133]QDV02765.1 hypothetical protein Pla86_35350 [Planctomycetes bacterium Pla86]
MNIDTIGLAAACALPLGFALIGEGSTTQNAVAQLASAPVASTVAAPASALAPAPQSTEGVNDELDGLRRDIEELRAKLEAARADSRDSQLAVEQDARLRELERAETERVRADTERAAVKLKLAELEREGALIRELAAGASDDAREVLEVQLAEIGAALSKGERMVQQRRSLAEALAAEPSAASTDAQALLAKAKYKAAVGQAQRAELEEQLARAEAGLNDAEVRRIDALRQAKAQLDAATAETEQVRSLVRKLAAERSAQPDGGGAQVDEFVIGKGTNVIVERIAAGADGAKQKALLGKLGYLGSSDESDGAKIKGLLSKLGYLHASDDDREGVNVTQSGTRIVRVQVGEGEGSGPVVEAQGFKLEGEDGDQPVYLELQVDSDGDTLQIQPQLLQLFRAAPAGGSGPRASSGGGSTFVFKSADGSSAFEGKGGNVFFGGSGGPSAGGGSTPHKIIEIQEGGSAFKGQGHNVFFGQGGGQVLRVDGMTGTLLERPSGDGDESREVQVWVTGEGSGGSGAFSGKAENFFFSDNGAVEVHKGQFGSDDHGDHHDGGAVKRWTTEDGTHYEVRTVIGKSTGQGSDAPSAGHFTHDSHTPFKWKSAEGEDGEVGFGLMFGGQEGEHGIGWAPADSGDGGPGVHWFSGGGAGGASPFKFELQGGPDGEAPHAPHGGMVFGQPGGGRELVVIHGDGSSGFEVHNHIGSDGPSGNSAELKEILDSMQQELKAIRKELAELRKSMGSDR